MSNLHSFCFSTYHIFLSLFKLRGCVRECVNPYIPIKSLRNIKVTICNHQANRPLLRMVWYLMWWLASLEKYGHIWHWMSLLGSGVIKHHKHKPSLVKHNIIVFFVRVWLGQKYYRPKVWIKNQASCGEIELKSHLHQPKWLPSHGIPYLSRYPWICPSIGLKNIPYFSKTERYFASINVFLVQVRLGQKYYTPQVWPDRDKNSWRSDFVTTFHATEMPALTTWLSVMFLNNPYKTVL